MSIVLSSSGSHESVSNNTIADGEIGKIHVTIAFGGFSVKIVETIFSIKTDTGIVYDEISSVCSVSVITIT